VSVAVALGGTVLAGGVYDPFKKELFMAAKGKGATLNGKRIRVSRERRLIRSLLVTGFPYNHQKRAIFHAQLLVPFLEKMADLRRLGAAALDLAWVASGRIDAYWEVGLKPWDVAAGWLLVEEAGGKVSDFKGEPLELDNTTLTLATNGVLHSQIRQHLKY
jgi:myo-inositol-1(or 4)-monophosphatase